MRLRVVSLALAIVLIPVFAYAQTPTPIARYDASTGLLPHEFNPNWVMNQTGSPSVSVVNGQLIVGSNDTSTDNVFWQWDSPGFQSGQGWAFIIRGGRTSSLGDVSGRPAVMEVSHIIGSGTDPDGFTEALALGVASANASNDDPRLLHRGRGPECSTTITDVTHEFWYYQLTSLSPSFPGGNGYMYVDNEYCFPTGAGSHGIAADYARFGIFDIGDSGQNEFVIESVEVYGVLVQPPTPLPEPTPTQLPCGPLVNCGFETGDTTGWTVNGGANVQPDGSPGFCGGAWAYEGTYALFQAANCGTCTLAGDLSQVASPSPGIDTVLATVRARDADGCQWSDGYVQIGIDPTAGTDATAATVQWGTPLILTGTFQEAASDLTVVTGPYTVFIRYEVSTNTTPPNDGWAMVNIDLVQVQEQAPNTAVDNWKASP